MLNKLIYLQNNIYINKKLYYINGNDIDNVDNSKYENNNNINSIKDLIHYLKKYNPELNIFKNYFILYNGKIITNNTKIKIQNSTNNTNNTNDTNNTNNTNDSEIKNYFELIERQNGGGLIDMFMSIIEIGGFFLKIGELIMWLLKFLLWLIKFILWAITDFLNPLNFLNDFFQTLMLIVVSICRLPFDIIGALFKIAINSIGGWMQGFWGWDMSGLTKNDKNSKYFKSFDRTKGQKTYITNANTVPFSIILGTILCPPMGVFMDMGTSGWLNIIICCLLTLLFYIPGLCYALLIIYS